MGALTSAMSQLCGEIVGMRKARHSFNRELAHESMQRRAAVKEMCAHHTSARMGMARKTKQARLAFLNGLQREVYEHCQALRQDLTGARRAWMGKSA